MPLLTRKKQFALIVEGTEGDAQTLALADVVMEVEELDMVYGPEFQERKPLRADLSPLPGTIGVTAGEITGRTELKPAATASDDPQIHRLLQALGLQQNDVKRIDVTGAETGNFLPGEYFTGDGSATGFYVDSDADNLWYVELVAIVASEVLTGSLSSSAITADNPSGEVDQGKAYRPDSTATTNSFTAAVMHDGLRKQIFGSRGDATFEVGGTGQIGFCNFTLNGAAVQPIDQVLFVPVVPSIIPATFVGSAVTVLQGSNSDSLCVDTFSLAIGNTVARRACSGSATGIKSFRITDRRPVLSIDPEVELEAQIDFFTKFGTAAVFGFDAQIGSGALKRTRILCPQVQYTELGNSDREGLSTYSASLLCTKGGHPSGDDEFLIVFY